MTLLGVKFWFQKFFFRISYIFIFLLFIGVFVYAYYTTEGSPPPADGMAPFLEDVEKQAALDTPLTLERSNYTPKELQGWINIAVSEVMSFDSENYQERMEEVRPNFTETGYKQYTEYLESSGLLQSLKEKDYRLSVYVDQAPLQLNDGPVNGVFRWLYQVPITISYVPRQVTEYTGEVQAVNKQVNVRVQIRRVALPGDDDAIQIESWNVSMRRN